MVSFLDNEGLRYYDERLKVWVEAKVGESSSISDEKIKELDEKVKTKVANSLDMSLDGTTYVLTVKLLSESGEELSKATVDLPIEELIKDGRYDDTTKEIVLILESGTEIRVPVGDLVENKVDKLDTKNVVYATDNSTPAKTIGIQYMESPLEGTIPVRDGIGSLQVPTAQDATQAVNKGQMDTALDGKVDKTTQKIKIYGTDADGQPYLYSQSSTSAIAYSVSLRNKNGQIVATDPTADNQCTTKKYVDRLSTPKCLKDTGDNDYSADVPSTGTSLWDALPNTIGQESITFNLGTWASIIGKFSLNDIVWVVDSNHDKIKVCQCTYDAGEPEWGEEHFYARLTLKSYMTFVTGSTLRKYTVKNPVLSKEIDGSYKWAIHNESHSFGGDEALTVQVYETATGKMVLPDISIAPEPGAVDNTVYIKFAADISTESIPANQYRAVIIG